MKQDVFTLSSGDAVLQWPAELTSEEYEDLCSWLDLIQRKVKRSVVSAGRDHAPEDETAH